MTKVLIITNTKDITCDYIIRQLKHNKIEFYRFNTNLIGKSIYLHFDIVNNHYTIYDSITNITLDVKSFSAVYYRRPELPTFDNKSLSGGEIVYINNEIIYTLEGLYKALSNVYWISPLSAIREAENKIHQLRIAQKIGFIIPQSIISNIGNRINEFQHFWRECIIKPVKSGLIHYSTGEKVFFTSLYHEENITDDMLVAPVFLQTLIHKDIDLRVTVVGKKVFAAAIHSQENHDSAVDWRRGENIPQHTQYQLPSNIERKCVKLLKILNLNFGAIDLVKDKNGNYIFLEINPNGQWAWIENQVGYNISGEIVKLLIKNDKMLKLKSILLNIWRNTRDCVWPIIDKIQQPSMEINCNIDNISNGKDRYEMLRKLYDEEFSRLHTVESKSTLFMGLFSVLSTILIRYILNDGGIESTLLIKSLFFWMIIQIVRCLCLAIKVLKREQYKTIGEKEICQPDTDEGRYYKEMCRNLVDAISFNKVVINKKVNHMTLLHLTLRNAMFTFLILVLVILFHEEIYYIWSYFRT